MTSSKLPETLSHVPKRTGSSRRLHPMDLNEEYPAIIVELKSGSEPFLMSGQPLTANLLDFWRWSASDLVSNATRGVLAEPPAGSS